jgi:hypothetical protein
MRPGGAAALAAGLLAACGPLARCELDQVRADVLDYERRVAVHAAEERALRARIAEFDRKIFTNEKAGVDLLRAELALATGAHARRLGAVKVRSHLLRKAHRQKVQALASLARAYDELLRAYPAADFAAIRAGLATRDQAMREMEAADLALTRLVRKYREQHR